MIQKIETLMKKWPLMVGIVFLVSMALLLSPVLLGEVGVNDDGAVLGFLKNNAWSNFLGRFHPLVLHLPIGALILVFSIELMGLRSKKYRIDMTLPLLFNAASSVVASVLGLLWYYGGDSSDCSSELLDSHMWKGLIYSVCALWLPLIYWAGKRRTQVLYYLTLLGSVVMMTVSAHDGGESLHGDIFKQVPWIEGGGEGRKHRHVTDSDPHGTEEEKYNPVLFTEIVVPILEAKCNECHHSANKVKSKLKFDTYADIIKGGAGQEDFPCLIPGDIKNSFFIESMELPEDDDYRMPPMKKEQMTADELVLLKWWVQVGAPEHKTLSEVEVSEAVRAILEKREH